MCSMMAHTPSPLASVAETSFTMPSATAWLGVFTPGFMSRPLLKLEQRSQDGTRGPQSVLMKTPTVNGR